MSYYQKHIFFCLNQKDAGKKCCQDANAKAHFDYAKQKLNALGLLGPHKIRLSSAGCLGRCIQGPAIVIYPEGVWYTYHSMSDIDHIIDEHIVTGKIVEALRINEETSS